MFAGTLGVHFIRSDGHRASLVVNRDPHSSLTDSFTGLLARNKTHILLEQLRNQVHGRWDRYHLKTNIPSSDLVSN